MKLGYYRTRGGDIARVACNDAPGAFPNVGYVQGKASVVYPAAWPEGGHFVSRAKQSKWDLIGDPITP